MKIIRFFGGFLFVSFVVVVMLSIIGCGKSGSDTQKKVESAVSAVQQPITTPPVSPATPAGGKPDPAKPAGGAQISAGGGQPVKVNSDREAGSVVTNPAPSASPGPLGIDHIDKYNAALKKYEEEIQAAESKFKGSKDELEKTKAELKKVDQEMEEQKKIASVNPDSGGIIADPNLGDKWVQQENAKKKFAELVKKRNEIEKTLVEWEKIHGDNYKFLDKLKKDFEFAKKNPPKNGGTFGKPDPVPSPDPAPVIPPIGKSAAEARGVEEAKNENR